MNQPGGQPASSPGDDKDDKEVGINFVDILFALVIGEALLALNRALQMPAAGVAHLVFAAVLTITSWIGYHRSRHRYTGIINFDVRRASNLLPLAKFFLDIVLVVLYWVAVQTTEWGFSAKGQSPSWRWTTMIAASVFAAYVLWDLVAWLSDGAARGPYRNGRRMVSVVFFVVTLIVLGVAAWWSPSGNYEVALIDWLLVLVVLAYRIAKDVA